VIGTEAQRSLINMWSDCTGRLHINYCSSVPKNISTDYRHRSNEIKKRKINRTFSSSLKCNFDVLAQLYYLRVPLKQCVRRIHTGQGLSLRSDSTERGKSNRKLGRQKYFGKNLRLIKHSAVACLGRQTLPRFSRMNLFMSFSLASSFLCEAHCCTACVVPTPDVRFQRSRTNRLSVLDLNLRPTEHTAPEYATM